MAPIKFYYFPSSPPSRMVEMVANLTGAPVEKHLIDLFSGKQHSEEFVKINPLHKIPFVVDGDLKLGESRAIAAYLVDKFMPEDNTLYPRDPVKRAKVDELLFFDSGSLYVSGFKLLGPKLFGPVKSLDAEAEKAYHVNLNYLEHRLKNNGGKKFLLGDHLTIADISIAATFTYAECAEYDLSAFKVLSAYLARLKAEIPKYSEINDEAVDKLRKYIQSKQQAQ